MNRPELADFLRKRREALTPGDVGLNPGERRRTPGLRREEVATLTGMSTDYYSRLEQGRGPQPSEQMIIALARGLRLTLDQRDHLYRLAGHNPPRRAMRSTHVSPALLRVLDRLHDTPVLVLSDLGETLAQNSPAKALLGDHSRFDGLERSSYFRWFTMPSERARYPLEDHPHQATVQAAALRAAYSMRHEDARSTEIIHALLEASEEFAEVWARHEIATRFDDRKTLLHPELGAIDINCQALFTEDQAQTLLVLTADPGTESTEKLKLLSVVGEQEFAV